MTEKIQRKSLLMYAMEGGVWLGLYLIARFVCGIVGAYSPLFNAVAMLLFLGTPVMLYYVLMRFHKQSGHLSGFAMLWMMGIMLFFFASLISCVPEYIFYQYITPDYIANAASQSVKLMEEMGWLENEATLEEVNKMLAADAVPSAIQMVLSSMWANVFFGSLLSIVVAPFVLRKKNKN